MVRTLTGPGLKNLRMVRPSMVPETELCRGSALSVMLALVFPWPITRRQQSIVVWERGSEKIFTGWEGRVQFGGEWGFRHAMEKNGFRQFLSVSDDFHGGDFILTPDQATPIPCRKMS